MDLTSFILYAIAVISITGGFIFVALKGGGGGKKKDIDYNEAAKEDVEHIFNDDFREELRNRGRLHFEKIINENAMFLQQDLRLTTSQINEFMKEEITRVLKEEFEKYEESINAAKDQALESINRTQAAIEEQRKILEEQIREQVAAEKTAQITKFQDHMAEILNHYIIEAVGTEIDISDQLDFIFANLNENKQAIIEDVKSGA